MKWCHEVEVGNIHCHESCILHGDDTIENHIDHWQFFGRGGYFAMVVDSVDAYCESHLVGFCLFGSDQAYKLPVCDVCPAVCRYLVLGDELDSVGGVFDAPSNVICQSPKFIGC